MGKCAGYRKVWRFYEETGIESVPDICAQLFHDAHVRHLQEGTGAVAEQEAQSSGDTAYVSTTGEDVSGGDAANEDASNKDTAVEAAQALIDALPEEVTAENADELQAQLMAIDEALAELSEEQAAGLDMTHYEKICAALNAPGACGGAGR